MTVLTRALRGLASVLVAAGLVAAGLGAASPVAAADAPRPLLGGWFGWWVTPDEARQMAAQSEGVIPEVSIFWWSFQGEKNSLCTFNPSSGSCWANNPTPWTTDNLDQVRKILQGAGIKVQGSITDVYSGTSGQLAAYLKDPKKRLFYAKRITLYALKAGLDGIDLDWENFAFGSNEPGSAVTRPRWIAFVKTLGEQLHAQGLTLSATVPGGPAVNDPSTGYDVYAWADIIDSVDRLQIMAYDYHGSWSGPGAIGPNDWAERVVQRAVTDVGKENADKVWIGAPQYGRTWPIEGAQGWSNDPDCPAGWKPNQTPGVTIMYASDASHPWRDASVIAAKQSIEPTWDPTSGEWHFTYDELLPGTYPKKVKGKKKPVPTDKNCTIERETWYADTRSALARASLVPENKIGGIAIWDFGTIQSDFYSSLADFGRQIAPAPTDVKVVAPRAVVHGKQAQIKVTATSRVGDAEGAKATLYWQSLTGTARPKKVDDVVLGKGGAGSFVAVPEKNGTWSVQVAGSWGRRAGESEQVKTKVKFAVGRKSAVWSPNVNTLVPLTAMVDPAQAGVSVTLQRQGPDGWVTLKTLTTAADGTASIAVHPTQVRPVTYRFIAKAVDDYAQGISRPLVLNVKPRAAYSVNEPVTRWGA